MQQNQPHAGLCISKTMPSRVSARQEWCEACEKSVTAARDHHAPVVAKTLITLLRHDHGRHRRADARQARLPRAGTFAKFAGRRARTQTAHMHTGGFAFFPQRFREREHEGLARIVDSHQRSRLERCGGRDIQHAAAFRLHHPGPIDLREFEQRANVQIDHPKLFVRFRAFESPRDAIARIVHQHIDAQALRGDILREFGATARRTQVARYRCRRDLVLAREFPRRVLECRRTSGGEDQIIAVLREALREIETDPVRCARHKRRQSFADFFARHRSLPV